MKRPRTIVSALVLSACVSTSQGVAVQERSRDLSGVWTNLPQGSRQLRSQLFTGQEPPMTSWGQEKYKTAKPTFGPRAVPVTGSNDPVYTCLPPGLPRIYFHPMPMEIVQLPDRVLMLFEHDSIVRRIWLDGHDAEPSELIPTYMGRSMGKWDGDTLVVETDTFNGRTWIDRAGHPTSENMRVVERIQRLDQRTLQIDVVVQDDVAYPTPLRDQFVYTLAPTWRIAEHACQDFSSFEQVEKGAI